MESYSVPSSPFDHYGVGDTDSSAESSYQRSSHSAQSSPYTSGRMLEPAHLIPLTSAAMANPSLASSHSILSLPSTTSSSSSSTTSPATLLTTPSTLTSLPSHSSSTSSLSTSPPTAPRDRPVRTKDRLKHSESENRRRTRLRHKFSLLRDASGCVKKDRYTILTTAVGKINELQARMQQAEQEKAALLLNINNITSQQQRQQQQQHAMQQQHKGELQSSSASPPAGPLSSLSSLSFYPLLSTTSCAFISLDGRILDTNAELCHRLRYQREELINSSLFALCDPAHLVDTVCVLKRLLDGDAHTWEMQRWCVTKDGGRVRMHATLAPVHHEGRLVFFLLLMVPAVQEEGGGGGGGQGRGSRGGEKEGASNGFSMDPVYSSNGGLRAPAPAAGGAQARAGLGHAVLQRLPLPPCHLLGQRRGAAAGGGDGYAAAVPTPLLVPHRPALPPLVVAHVAVALRVPPSSPLSPSSTCPPTAPPPCLRTRIRWPPPRPPTTSRRSTSRSSRSSRSTRSRRSSSSSSSSAPPSHTSLLSPPPPPPPPSSSSSSSPLSYSTSHPPPPPHYSRAPSMPPYPSLPVPRTTLPL